jgi:hypothetical protein
MKTLTLYAAVLSAGSTLFAADTIQPVAQTGARTPVQRLEEIRQKNKQLLEKQAETLKLLEQLELQSQQLKFMGRRT